MTNLLATLRALADETRMRLLAVLDRGYFNVNELTKLLNLSQPTISHHLKALAQAGLVTSRKEGAATFYRLAEKLEGSVHATLLDVVRLECRGSERGGVAVLNEDLLRVEELLSLRRDESRAFFDKVAIDWDALREEAQGHQSYIELLAREVPPEGTVLEVGCGTGSLLTKVVPRSGATIAVDNSPRMLEQARKRLSKHASKVDLRLGTFEHLPVGNNEVDLAVSHMVLHHVSDPRSALLDLARVVKPGGSVLIVDLVEHHNELMRTRYADLWLGFNPGDFSHWLSDCGFSGVRMQFLGPGEEAFLVRGTRNEMRSNP